MRPPGARRLRVVVVGAGMVGTRFADELHARAGAAADITVLGAERHEPYNRVLLSDVVAGRADAGSLALPSPAGARVLRATAAVQVDRDARTVTCDDGSVHAYDALVLATGARARIPDLAGLAASSGRLPRGVHALRTLDDAAAIVAAASAEPEAVVLGGGVLGVEVATGLAHRGVTVTMAHPGPHAMDTQLGDGAGAALATGLGRLGVRVRTGVRAAAVGLDARGVAHVVLARAAREDRGDGTPDGDGRDQVACRLLVLTTGTVPETALAAGAGLPVGRGILVDGNGATADPAVFAIGDCAEPPGGATGLVAQGWAQARRTAVVVAELARGAMPLSAPPEDAPDDEGAHDVVRVKAHGLAVTSMGVPAESAPPDARCVRLSDRSAGRHVEVVVRDGVLVGAACVGEPGVVAGLVAAYTRRTPVPRDPAHLLLGPVRGGEPVEAASPTLMPDRATVCRCNGVTKGDVVATWRHGARSVEEVVRATRATTGCGGCRDAVCGLVEWLGRVDPDPAPADREDERTGDRDGEAAREAVPVRA